MIYLKQLTYVLNFSVNQTAYENGGNRSVFEGN